MAKSNVIDLNSRRRGSGKSRKKNSHSAQVLDMTARRSEMVDQERRQVKRTILREFIGVSAVVPEKGLLKLEMHDISKGGLAFDLEGKHGGFSVGEEIALRVYLNRDTYFKFAVQIQNVRMIEDEGVIRHGANFQPDSANSVALKFFIKFIESVSANLERDGGDITVSNLGGL